MHTSLIPQHTSTQEVVVLPATTMPPLPPLPTQEELVQARAATASVAAAAADVAKTDHQQQLRDAENK